MPHNIPVNPSHAQMRCRLHHRLMTQVRINKTPSAKAKSLILPRRHVPYFTAKHKNFQFICQELTRLLPQVRIVAKSKKNTLQHLHLTIVLKMYQLTYFQKPAQTHFRTTDASFPKKLAQMVSNYEQSSYCMLGKNFRST